MGGQEHWAETEAEAAALFLALLRQGAAIQFVEACADDQAMWRGVEAKLAKPL
jgi:hypothetical protein